MVIEVLVPSPGESIKQVQLANWLVANGDFVQKDQEVVEIDSDKASLAISATESGKISFSAQPGDTLPVGAVIFTIEPGVDATIKEEITKPSQDASDNITPGKIQSGKADSGSTGKEAVPAVRLTPLAKKVLQEKGMDEKDVVDYLRQTRIHRREIEKIISSQENLPDLKTGKPEVGFSRSTERKMISTLRQKLSERLVAVKNQTAMLTTFNEVDMTEILGIKSRFNEKFKEKYGVSIGLMSFFTKAITLALQEFPQVNARIDGEEMIFSGYVDMGIAVSAPKGLVVPVIRNAESLSLPDIELTIRDLAAKARSNKITLEEMTGGTFTISNGGVFGSMMSTPILNPPQAAILGMHAIIDRPVAINGQVVIRPMMYLALSYDHRIIDGKESVSFLVRVKEILESPARMIAGGKDPFIMLLGL